MSDNLFRLGWLSVPELGPDCLRTLAEKAETYGPMHISERDTTAIFVEPLLRGLGWDTLEVDHVQRENQGGWCIVDVHLVRSRERGGTTKPAAVIEVESLKAGHLDPGYWQLRSNVFERLFTGRNPYTQPLHLGDKPWVRGVITDGATWIVYDFDSTAKGIQRREDHLVVCDFELQRDGDASQLIRALDRNYLLETLRKAFAA